MDSSKSLVCITEEGDSSSWRTILAGNYLYTFGDYGNIIIAVEKNKPVKELIYTNNMGVDWTKIKFTSNLVYADELIKEQLAETSMFFLFTSDAKNKQRSVFKININFIAFSSEESEETSVENLKCAKKCISKTNNKEICLSDELICDGFYDCKDNQDEQTCSIEPLVSPVNTNLFEASLQLVDLKIKNNMFKLNFSIALSEQMKNYDVNRCIVKVVSLKDIKLMEDNDKKSLIIPKTSDYFKKLNPHINLDLFSFDNHMNADLFQTLVEIQTEKLQNVLELGNLNDQLEYLLLFYVDLSYDSKSSVYMLEKSLVIRADPYNTLDPNVNHLLVARKFPVKIFAVACFFALALFILIAGLFVIAFNNRKKPAANYLVLAQEKPPKSAIDRQFEVYESVVKAKKLNTIYKTGPPKEDKLNLIEEMA